MKEISYERKKTFFGILIGLIAILLAGCNAEDRIKGTWYIINASKEVTLDIYDETAVYHNNGEWDDCYIEWTLDEDNLVLNAEGRSFYYQVLDDSEYGQVLYDPEEGKIYACHEREKAEILINEILEEREQERQMNLQIFEELLDELKSLIVGTWEREVSSVLLNEKPTVYTYKFNEDGTYSYTSEGPHSYDCEHKEGTYRIVSYENGEEVEYNGVGDPYDIHVVIALSDPNHKAVYKDLDSERLKEGYLCIRSSGILDFGEEYRKID